MLMGVYFLVWYGLLCIRGGIYNGAMFKFTLLIPANYPDGGCPVGILLYNRHFAALLIMYVVMQEFGFQSGVFHPMVDVYTGTLDTKKEFQRWRRDVNHIHHLLTYARKIFHNIDPLQPVNEEAAKL